VESYPRSPRVAIHNDWRRQNAVRNAGFTVRTAVIAGPVLSVGRDTPQSGVSEQVGEFPLRAFPTEPGLVRDVTAAAIDANRGGMVRSLRAEML